MLSMIATVTLIYFSVQWVALGTLPGLGRSQTPLAEAASGFAGGWLALLMTVGAAVSILGTNSNTVMLGPRYLHALASDGYGPRVLAGIHPRFRTPVPAIVTVGALSLALALSGSFVQLALLSIIARLATYIGTAAAVPVLRRKFPRREDAFVLPGGPTIPVLALLLCIAFLLSAEMKNLIAGAIGLAIGAVIYFTRRAPAAPAVTPTDS
jgi:amino acid transporter